MFLAIAVLLIQPQVAPQVSFSAEKITFIQPSNSFSSTDYPTSNSLTSTSAAAEVDSSTTAPETTALVASSDLEQPTAASASEALPVAPAPISAGGTPVTMAFIKPGKPMTVSVDELLAENRRKRFLWTGFVIASSGAATFDAWTTRRAISGSGAQELNPMLRPFAGNASLYAAIQVGPALMDYAGRKMMYSRHTWVRRMWWVPQSASFVSSIFCGAHNLSYRRKFREPVSV